MHATSIAVPVSPRHCVWLTARSLGALSLCSARTSSLVAFPLGRRTGGP